MPGQHVTFGGAVAGTTSPFVGTRTTLAGDVNGDGRVDLVAVNNGGNFVMTSNGTSFTWSGQWSAPFYGGN